MTLSMIDFKWDLNSALNSLQITTISVSDKNWILIKLDPENYPFLKQCKIPCQLHFHSLAGPARVWPAFGVAGLQGWTFWSSFGFWLKIILCFEENSENADPLVWVTPIMCLLMESLKKNVLNQKKGEVLSLWLIDLITFTTYRNYMLNLKI